MSILYMHPRLLPPRRLRTHHHINLIQPSHPSHLNFLTKNSPSVAQCITPYQAHSIQSTLSGVPRSRVSASSASRVSPSSASGVLTALACCRAEDWFTVFTRDDDCSARVVKVAADSLSLGDAPRRSRAVLAVLAVLDVLMSPAETLLAPCTSVASVVSTSDPPSVGVALRGIHAAASSCNRRMMRGIRKYLGSTSGVGISTAAVHPIKAMDQRIVTRWPVIDQRCVA
jgi:hypothetical protein